MKRLKTFAYNLLCLFKVLTIVPLGWLFNSFIAWIQCVYEVFKAIIYDLKEGK